MIRLAAALQFSLAFGACEPPERLAGSAPVDLRSAMPRSALEPVPLEVSLLVTHSDYDAWKDAVVRQSPPVTAYVPYEEALVRRRGTERTFVRWVVLAHRPDLTDGYRARLCDLVDDLTSGETDPSPEEVWCGSGAPSTMPDRGLAEEVISRCSGLAAKDELEREATADPGWAVRSGLPRATHRREAWER